VAKEEGDYIAVATFDKKYLFRLIGKSLSDKRLSKYVQDLGMSVEGLRADEIDVDVTPNRPDLLDIVGFARALKNYMHHNEKLEYKIKEDTPITTINVGKNVGKVRPYISSFVVKKLDLTEESLKYIINFTEKFSETFGRRRSKLAMGLHDFSKVSGELRYDAKLEGRFTPLNSKKEMNFEEIMKIHEKGMLYGHTIKGSLYPVLEDSKGIMSLIPIINSDRTKITKNTKEILVDITGTSQYIVEKAADLFACMFIDLKGEINRVRIRYEEGNKSIITPLMKEKIIEIRPRQIEDHIGVAIGFNNILSLANKMGYKAVFINKKIRFFVPQYRLDVINEQDVIEDIAIGYGYDYIHPLHLFSEVEGGSLELKTKTNRKLVTLMLGLGFSEGNNNYFTNEKTNFEMMRIEEKPHIQVKESKTENITMLRTWLLPSLLSILGRSAHEKMPQKLFELDLVFEIENNQVVEKHHLAGVYASPKINFNDIKAVVSAIFNSLGLEQKIREDKIGSFIDGRCARIEGGKVKGFFGELHPEVLSNFGIEEPTVAFELELPY
jgi:phenylalanyl-tRNA synthetase beta chain